jgi:hypothetical protein
MKAFTHGNPLCGAAGCAVRRNSMVSHFYSGMSPPVCMYVCRRSWWRGRCATCKSSIPPPPSRFPPLDDLIWKNRLAGSQAIPRLVDDVLRSTHRPNSFCSTCKVQRTAEPRRRAVKTILASSQSIAQHRITAR